VRHPKTVAQPQATDKREKQRCGALVKQGGMSFCDLLSLSLLLSEVQQMAATVVPEMCGKVMNFKMSLLSECCSIAKYHEVTQVSEIEIDFLSCHILRMFFHARDFEAPPHAKDWVNQALPDAQTDKQCGDINQTT
jgi:hypothetical protein